MSYKLADGSRSTEYKVGDKFLVAEVEGSTFSQGSIVELYLNDGTSCPVFRLVTGECEYDNCNGKSGACCSWYCLSKLTLDCTSADVSQSETSGYLRLLTLADGLMTKNNLTAVEINVKPKSCGGSGKSIHVYLSAKELDSGQLFELNWELAGLVIDHELHLYDDIIQFARMDE